ncbi:hypothetical protein PRIPAC_76840 [Pristionchus pacificus]|nr:hypothetical protein PRIPAC_76840 [Pristionchus pacificus]
MIMGSILSLLFLSIISSSSGYTEIEQLIDAKGRTLFLIKEARTWEDADSFCGTLFSGGRLVSIRDETEAHDLALMINDKHPDYHWGGQLTYYVGGRWNANENVWINIDGSHLPQSRRLCDGGAMTIGVMWKDGQIMPTCSPDKRAMYFICGDPKE